MRHLPTENAQWMSFSTKVCSKSQFTLLWTWNWYDKFDASTMVL